MRDLVSYSSFHQTLWLVQNGHQYWAGLTQSNVETIANDRNELIWMLAFSNSGLARWWLITFSQTGVVESNNIHKHQLETTGATIMSGSSLSQRKKFRLIFTDKNKGLTYSRYVCTKSGWCRYSDYFVVSVSLISVPRHLIVVSISVKVNVFTQRRKKTIYRVNGFVTTMQRIIHYQLLTVNPWITRFFYIVFAARFGWILTKL